jgi:hypothetical protein
MTVQAATRMWSQHSADVTTDDGRNVSASVREMYQIVCDPTDGPNQVLLASSLPVLGQLYSGTSAVRCKQRSPKQVSPILWTCEIAYEGPIWTELGSSPLDAPPVIKWSKVESEEEIDEDLNGNAIVTANKERIEGVTKKISDLAVTITRNYAAIDLPTTYRYLQSVNSDVFLGFAPGVGRMTQFSADSIYDEDVGGYWQVTAGIEFRYPWRTTAAKAWYARVLHQGYRVKVGSDIQNAVDDQGQEVSKPVLLDSSGNETTTAEWLEFQLYEPLPYNALGLV